MLAAAASTESLPMVESRSAAEAVVDWNRKNFAKREFCMYEILNTIIYL